MSHTPTLPAVPEGIPLLEAEHIACGREPGDGSPQRTVIEQIEKALEGQVTDAPNHSLPLRRELLPQPDGRGLVAA